MLHPPALFHASRLVLACLLLSPLAVGASDEARLELGKAVFKEQATPPCAICHTLADAGAAGTIGPNLDELRPSAEQVETAVRGGLGIMPAFESLSEEQVEAVAEYVSAAAGKN